MGGILVTVPELAWYTTGKQCVERHQLLSAGRFNPEIWKKPNSDSFAGALASMGGIRRSSRNAPDEPTDRSGSTEYAAQIIDKRSLLSAAPLISVEVSNGQSCHENSHNSLCRHRN